ncbi:hypothetical protein BH11BAC3_BH11BAC3_38790 [soil metagenome]
MKTYYQNFVAISLFIFLVNNFSYSQVSYGIKSGINLSTTDNLIAYPTTRVGWYVGGLSKIALNKRISFQPEIYYSSKGNRSKNQLGSLKITTRLNYINLPLLLNYKILNTTHLIFGPELGYMTAAHIALSNGENFNKSDNYFHKFDIGLSLGIHHKMCKNIEAEFRYTFGFKTLYSTDLNGERNNPTNGANRVIQIGLQYILK